MLALLGVVRHAPLANPQVCQTGFRERGRGDGLCAGAADAVKPGSPTKAGASVITRVASKTPSGPASLHKAGVAVVSAVAMRGRTTTSTQQRLRAQDDRAAHEEAGAVRRREEALAKKAEEEAATMESLKASVRPPWLVLLASLLPAAGQ